MEELWVVASVVVVVEVSVVPEVASVSGRPEQRWYSKWYS
jgi:hypothetical protein